MTFQQYLQCPVIRTITCQGKSQRSGHIEFYFLIRFNFNIYVYKSKFIIIPEDFARVASPKMMTDCHMLRINVCDAGRQAETRKRVDIY